MTKTDIPDSFIIEELEKLKKEKEKDNRIFIDIPPDEPTEEKEKNSDVDFTIGV